VVSYLWPKYELKSDWTVGDLPSSVLEKFAYKKE
jgi:hypothetical protein